jgi:hypothetical protein
MKSKSKKIFIVNAVIDRRFIYGDYCDVTYVLGVETADTKRRKRRLIRRLERRQEKPYHNRFSVLGGADPAIFCFDSFEPVKFLADSHRRAYDY